MALHFSANQFNKEFDPRRLGNWELPRRYPSRPHQRKGQTHIIANDQGHLLPGVPRPQSIAAGPWGHFIPTWRMPKRITRKIAEELRDPQAARKRQHLEIKPPEPPKEAKPPEPSSEIKKPIDETPSEDPCANLLDKTVESEPGQDLSYVPGDLTATHQRHSSYALLRPKKTETLSDIQEKDMAERRRRHSTESCRGRSPKINPFACVYRNFEMAKKCAKENLEHHPLPDTITDAMYRKLQMQRAKEPGLVLAEEGRAAAVGWKGYGATGPTQCSKFRVYRPKTCAHMKLKKLEDPRPGSCGTFDMKWRFIKQKNVTPIELAICWDMRPENPGDEPKRTTHIDGSNGSAAPAVFAMVHSPKQPSPDAHDEASKEGDKWRKPSAPGRICDGIHGCGTITSCSGGCSRSGCNTPPKFEKKRPKTAARKLDTAEVLKARNLDSHLDTNNKLDRRSISTNSLYVNAPITRKLSKESVYTVHSAKNKLHQSSPNLSTISCCGSNCSKASKYEKKLNRPCMACENSKPGLDNIERAKSEYKMAFKAGKLAEKSDSSSSGSRSKNSVKVPKQKEPYAKRNYDINSLHPPFTIWKGTSCQSYPEHWRLASIYQHSYKPVENRKKPLLASLYQ